MAAAVIAVAGVARLQAVVVAGYGIVERHVVSAVEHYLEFIYALNLKRRGDVGKFKLWGIRNPVY